MPKEITTEIARREFALILSRLRAGSAASQMYELVSVQRSKSEPTTWTVRLTEDEVTHSADISVPSDALLASLAEFSARYLSPAAWVLNAQTISLPEPPEVALSIEDIDAAGMAALVSAFAGMPFGECFDRLRKQSKGD